MDVLHDEFGDMSHQQLAAPVDTVEVRELARDVIETHDVTDIRTCLTLFILGGKNMF